MSNNPQPPPPQFSMTEAPLLSAVAKKTGHSLLLGPKVYHISQGGAGLQHFSTPITLAAEAKFLVTEIKRLRAPFLHLAHNQRKEALIKVKQIKNTVALKSPYPADLYSRDSTLEAKKTKGFQASPVPCL